MAGPPRGDVLSAGNVEAGKGEGGPLREQSERVHRLGPEHFRNPRRRVQIDDGPAGQEGGGLQAEVGIDRRGTPDGTKERKVVHTVRVGPAPAERDVFGLRPLPHGLQLPDCPDEASSDGAAVALDTLLVDVGGIAGGDDMIESEPLGQRLDQVGRGGRRQYEHPASLAVGVEQGRNVGGGSVPPAARRLPPPPGGSRPASRRQGRRSGGRHRRQALAEHVVYPHQQGLAERRCTGAPQEGPVQVEGRRGSGHAPGPYPFRARPGPCPAVSLRPPICRTVPTQL